ncbi:GNAT family N-acetyltransferase [Serratia ureilytica]
MPPTAATPDVARYQSWERLQRRRCAAGPLSHSNGGSNSTDDSWFQLEVERRGGRRCSAISARVHFFDEGRQAELGVTFAPSHQRQGLAREALNAVIALLFGPLAKHRITAVDARNPCRRHAVRQTGFFARGPAGGKTCFFKGAWGDEFGFALLQSEWRENAKA